MKVLALSIKLKAVIIVNHLENVETVSVFVWMDWLVMSARKLFVQITAVTFMVRVLVINPMVDVFVRIIGLGRCATSSKLKINCEHKILYFHYSSFVDFFLKIFKRFTKCS